MSAYINIYGLLSHHSRLYRYIGYIGAGGLCAHRVDLNFQRKTMSNLTYWEKAIPLAQAYVTFAHREDADRYRELLSETSITAIQERTEQRIAEGEPGLEAVFHSMGPMSSLGKLRRKLEDQCLNWIKTGKLTAYGFVVPRKLNDAPIEVPHDLWDGLVKWDSSAVERHGLRIEGIRLIQPSKIDRIRADLSAQPEGRGRGRRTRKPHILEAFETLHGLGEIDYQKPMARLYPVIRNWVMVAYPDDPDGENGLDDGTISRHINKPFNERKDDSKL